jgi:hypothetical protein
MVAGMYGRLGFERTASETCGETRWVMELGGFAARVVPIEVNVLREALV